MFYLVNDFVVPVVVNDAVYNQTVQQNGPFYVNETYNTAEDAKNRAEELFLTWFGRVASFGFPVTGTCYVPDPSSKKDQWSMLSMKQHTAGTFLIDSGSNLYITISQSSTEDNNRITIGSNGIYCFDVYGENGPVPALQNSGKRTQIGFISLPASAYKNGVPDPDWFNNSSNQIHTGGVGFGYYYNPSSNKYIVRANATTQANGNLSKSGFYSTFSTLTPMSETDPYSQGEESESVNTGVSNFTGIGGDGSYTKPGYSGGVPSLPTLSAVDTGLLKLYCSSSAAGLNGLANYLWSSAFDVDTFKKLFADPMDLIFGAAILPCSPPSTASVILFGSINTNVQMPQATEQYVSVDCGTLDIPLYYGSFLDYAPHTRISIYLPYIGMRELNATEIVGKTLGVVYHVDVLTGACVAFITVNTVVMYEFSGSCAVQIPITSNNWASVLQSLATVGGMAIGGFAAGGPVGALVAGGTSAASNAMSGGLSPSFQRGGSVSGSAGLLADQDPYIVIEIPNMCKAYGQNVFEGYPNYTTLKLSSCRGFTRVQSVHLEGIGCTGAELAEIERILKEGVII